MKTHKAQFVKVDKTQKVKGINVHAYYFLQKSLLMWKHIHVQVKSMDGGRLVHFQ
jgi:hypothetical protein